MTVACPTMAAHTTAPDSYLAWSEWAERMARTHVQERCPGCGLYKIWRVRPTATPATEDRGDPVSYSSSASEGRKNAYLTNTTRRMASMTSARDRAIEVIAQASPRWSRDESAAALEAWSAVDALLARPDVLRALAEAGQADAEQLGSPTQIQPRCGMRFLHARQLVKTPGKPVKEWPPETCEVTRVTATAVYFRNSSGYKSYLPPEKFPSVVREILTQ